MARSAGGTEAAASSKAAATNDAADPLSIRVVVVRHVLGLCYSMTVKFGFCTCKQERPRALIGDKFKG